MKQQNSLGIFLMILGCIFFALMNACIKILSTEISIMQSALFRSVLMGIFVASLFLFQPLRKTNVKGGYLALFARAFFGSSSMILFFYNISTIPLGIASTFAQTVPLYAVFFAWIFLKEKLPASVFYATIIGFIGIILISNPKANIPLHNILIGILSGATAAAALVSIRGCKKYFDERLIILAFALTATLMSALFLGLGIVYPKPFLAYNPIPPSAWIYILAMGLSGTIGQYLMTKAFMLAPAGIVSPLDYTKIVFSLFLGMLLGDPAPNFQSTIGMSLVILSGVLIALPVFIKDYKKARNEANLKH